MNGKILTLRRNDCFTRDQVKGTSRSKHGMSGKMSIRKLLCFKHFTLIDIMRDPKVIQQNREPKGVSQNDAINCRCEDGALPRTPGFFEA